ncbi:hypothetical protein [Kitasatospora sp. NPDC056184]|uniref:hypothetical protein n=1 Tax=Kitasatospora sp. NPDC056184 TaxID=3345738 RepID=UPI0035D9F052
MRITTTAGRAAAVALAAAAFGLGATTSAQAAWPGGDTTITNGGCSVRATYAYGLVTAQVTATDDSCTFFVHDAAGSAWFAAPTTTGNLQWQVLMGADRKLIGCLRSGATFQVVCAPLV